MTLDSQTVKYK